MNQKGDQEYSGRDRLTIKKGALIQDQDLSSGGGFHYSREERLKMAHHQTSGAKQSWFRKNRSLLITLLDIALLVIIAVLFNTVLSPKPWQDSSPGYSVHLEVNEFGDQILTQMLIRRASEEVEELTVKVGFYLLAHPRMKPGDQARILDHVHNALINPAKPSTKEIGEGIETIPEIDGLRLVTSESISELIRFEQQTSPGIRTILNLPQDTSEVNGSSNLTVLGFVLPITSHEDESLFPPLVVLKEF